MWMVCGSNNAIKAVCFTLENSHGLIFLFSLSLCSIPPYRHTNKMIKCLSNCEFGSLYLSIEDDVNDFILLLFEFSFRFVFSSFNTFIACRMQLFNVYTK